MPHYENPNIHFALPVYGMSGYIENFYDNNGEGKAPVFILTDSQEPEELCLFIQAPDCYREAMMYATLAYYKRVNIFANQINIRTISTLFNLVKDLTSRNIDAYVFYPMRFNANEIPDDYVRNRFKKLSNWQSHVYPDISVEYRVSDPVFQDSINSGELIPKSCMSYDIVIKIPKETIYLPALVNYDKMNQWCKPNRKVLVPYLTRYYDHSITYVDLDTNENWISKYSTYTYARSFPTQSSFITAKNGDPNLNLPPIFPASLMRHYTY